MFENPPVRRIDPCSLGAWINGLDEKSRDNLVNWLDSDWITNRGIREMIIDQADKSFSVDTISDHRGNPRRCRCAALDARV